MGEQKVSLLQDQVQMQRFMKMLLNDVEALDHMLKNDYFESDITRIGAEQEMVLIDSDTYKPAPMAMEALELMKDLEWAETELAKFNLEIGVDPKEFTGSCLSELENEIRTKLKLMNKRMSPLNIQLLLTGILPTLRKYDLGYHNLTPKKRYRALMEALNSQRGEDHRLRLLGVDELIVKHDSPLMEAVNTSFQVHLQVTPDQFVPYYNIAQTLAAPILAIAANSPIVFGRRLWHETRIAIFQQSIDTRTTLEHMRQRSPRVSFGDSWLEDSILDIYKEDIARFRVLIAGDEEEDSLQVLKEGKIPKLRALQIHNSTVYRWNRPCYGISSTGKPHLRIENRVFAAGPCLCDEIANAALWLGAMMGYGADYAKIQDYIAFSDVKDNFRKAARYGIDTKFSWMHDQKISAVDLLLGEIIPMARKGLERMNVVPEDIDNYMGIIQARSESHSTGARWLLRTYTDLIKQIPRDEAITSLTASILKNQSLEKPIHEWEMIKPEDLTAYKPSTISVDEFMDTDIFTVQKDDLLDLVGDLIIWKRIKYVPVENDKGDLEGLITSRHILKRLLKARKTAEDSNPMVRDIMIEDVITIDPEATILEALNSMKDNNIGCLPVVRKGELIGMITEEHFLNISVRLLERLDMD